MACADGGALTTQALLPILEECLSGQVTTGNRVNLAVNPALRLQEVTNGAHY